MEFNVTIKKNFIVAKIYGPQPWENQSFFSIVDTLSDKIEDVYRVRNLPVVFDLTNVNFIDSYLISAFVKASIIAEKSDKYIITDNDNVITIVELVSLDKLFLLVNTFEEILNEK